jgi:hypothetical protein
VFDLNVHSEGAQEAVRIFIVDIELILSQVLDKGVLLFARLVDKGDLLFGSVVKSELITHFPRVGVVFASSSEF